MANLFQPQPQRKKILILLQVIDLVRQVTKSQE